MAVNKFKYLILGLIGGLLVILFIFFLPLWDVPTEVIESYKATEMHTEVVCVDEAYLADKIEKVSKVLIDGMYPINEMGRMSGPLSLNSINGFASSTIYLSVDTEYFYIDKPDTMIVIKSKWLPSVSIVNQFGQTLITLTEEQSDNYLKQFPEIQDRYEVPVGKYRIESKWTKWDHGGFQDSLPYNNIYYQPKAYIYASIEWPDVVGQVTKYRAVEKYIEVPVQVIKQRLITRQEKATLCEFIVSRYSNWRSEK